VTEPMKTQKAVLKSKTDKPLNGGNVILRCTTETCASCPIPEPQKKAKASDRVPSEDDEGVRPLSEPLQ